MAEKFTCHGQAAVGTDKSILNLFNPAAAPTSRGRVEEVTIGCAVTPADQASRFYLGRTTALGTEGSGFTPNNTDSAGPAGAYDSGVGTFSAEPTYTANKELLEIPLNQRATFRWIASPGFPFLLAATQNNGAGLKSSTATGTAVHGATILFEE